MRALCGRAAAFRKIANYLQKQAAKSVVSPYGFYSKYPAVKAFVANRKLSCEVFLATRKKRSGTDRRYQ